MDPQLMTTKEAAAFLRVHMVTLSQWAKHGYVPGVKVGKNWRFARHELTAWLNDPVRRLHLVPTANEPVPPPRARKRPTAQLGVVQVRNLGQAVLISQARHAVSDVR